ncbi:hypothetical protein [Lysobacter gummosus]|uniref:hypothetical protein n=1 Tax=Lysobacter gummosus TaxID=262324 RepID=UPI00363B7CA9
MSRSCSSRVGGCHCGIVAVCCLCCASCGSKAARVLSNSSCKLPRAIVPGASSRCH